VVYAAFAVTSTRLPFVEAGGKSGRPDDSSSAGVAFGNP